MDSSIPVPAGTPAQPIGPQQLDDPEPPVLDMPDDPEPVQLDMPDDPEPVQMEGSLEPVDVDPPSRASDDLGYDGV
jgi:hypothetical protein